MWRLLHFDVFPLASRGGSSCILMSILMRFDALYQAGKLPKAKFHLSVVGGGVLSVEVANV